MKLAPLALIVLAACPGDDDGNPDRLWLAADGVETEVKLQDAEPRPW
jgi:hypothetical protein